MNDDLNVEPIHDKRTSDVKNMHNADESFDLNVFNLNPRANYDKKSPGFKNHQHDDHYTEIDEEFENYIKDDKVNIHNIKYEITILIGQSDYDSKKINGNIRSKMVEKHLDLFKRIDSDISNH